MTCFHKVFTVVFLLIVFSSCASRKVQHRSADSSDLLFPYGVYQHDIGILIAKTDTMKEIKLEFKGVVRLKPDAVQMVALSHFGTTVFKINENLITHEIKTDVFVDEMKKFETELPRYYSVLRLFLIEHVSHHNLKWNQTDPAGLPLEAETIGFAKNARFRFKNYDANQIPEEIQIFHPNFSVTVKVTDYEI